MLEVAPYDGDYGRSAQADGRSIDWSAHERDTLIGGRRVRYVEIGEGALGFVLVHGMGGCWQHWSQTLPSLAAQGRALALDLPGFGRSAMPQGRISLELFADTAAALARARGLERVVFIGHSMGGPIGLRFAQRHPRLTQAVIFVAGAVYSFSRLLGRRELARAAREHPRTAAAALAELLTCGVPVPASIKRQIATRASLRRAALWPYVYRPAALPAEQAAMILAGAGARGVFQTASAIGGAQLFRGLSEIDRPTLSIGARHDRVVPLADLRAFQAAAPRIDSVLIEGAGHMLMLERARAFNEQIARFLATLRP